MKKLLVVTMLLVASCGTTQKKEPVQAAPALAELFKSAKTDSAKKEYKTAANKFNRIIREAPESQLAAESQIAIGDMFFNQNRWADAYNYYTKVINGPIRTPVEADANVKAAQCLLNQDKMSEALNHADAALKISGISKETNLSALKLRLQILKRMSAPLEELKTLLYLYANTESSATKQEYKLQALSVVDTSLSPTQLEEVAQDSKYGFAQPPALFRIGVYYFERSEFSKARSYLGGAASAAPNTEISERANELLSQISAREQVNPRRIGVVLPLTGKLQKVGYKTLRGIQLGLGIFGKSSSGLELAVVDSGSNAANARRAVEKLVVDDHVIAIIGSLSSKEASAVASKAQELGVPNITLSQKAGLTEVGDYIFRNALTSEMQVKQLVNEAMKVRGYTKFAILYPQDSYGTEFANIFWDEVIKQGGEIRGVQAYKSGETDYNIPVRKLVGTYDIEARKWEYKLRMDEHKKTKPQHVRKDDTSDLLPPIVDFEAVFIPDSAKALGQVAPTLAYNDVKNVTLIGTNLWNTPMIIERAGKFLKDPLFVDSFLTSDASLQNTPFFKEYQQVFSESPEEFELQAYDSAVILRQIIDAGASTRVEIQSKLVRLSQAVGALGPLTVTESREVVRPMVLLTVKDNQIVRASDATLPR